MMMAPWHLNALLVDPKAFQKMESNLATAWWSWVDGIIKLFTPVPLYQFVLDINIICIHNHDNHPHVGLRKGQIQC